MKVQPVFCWAVFARCKYPRIWLKPVRRVLDVFMARRAKILVERMLVVMFTKAP